ncbi:MAG TPA: RHS repeat-associated core domain-containing protein [Pyrinomonadaceae bacterium]|nr:RHS repeat-associated core domain-containing protein [Pyrinomonadaceae bacterium]
MKRTAYSILLGLIIVVYSFGQSGTNENGADRTLRGSGRVNPSTLGMEIEIPLGNYPGRGINVPVNLSYSSKLWRMEVNNYEPQGNNPSLCRAVNHPKYAEKSASGWTTSLATPYIEYIGEDNIFKQNGKPSGETSCLPDAPGNNPPNAYVRRVMLNLPSGETHELRIDDTIKVFPNNQNCADNNPNTICDANDPSRPESWSGWYYAVDGSNIKYFEDRVNNIYFLQMPDGSRYEFSNIKTSFETANIRKGTKFIDRNGNFTSFNEPTTQYPNGSWTDTLGKNIGVPFGLNEPSQPTVQTYAMPGMTGGYKFYWRKLKGETATESALTDFNTALKHPGDNKFIQGQDAYPGNTTLFHSEFESVVRDGALGEYFNPVVLNEIELPTGEKYKFTYDVYGRIEQVIYPTGGIETFQFQEVPTLSVLERDDVSAQTNFGVTNRKVYYGNSPANFYQWTYNAQHVAPKGYKVSITNPDNTIVERFLHRGTDSSPLDQYGNYGYDEALAGMAYEERMFSNSGTLVSRKLTNWTKTELSTNGGPIAVAAHWHPRVMHEETIVFDNLGNGVSATNKTEYEGNLNLRETPVLGNKTKEYAYIPIVAGSSFGSGSGDSFAPGEPPAPNPVPIPPTEPPTLLRTKETTYLQTDPNIGQMIKDIYKNQNMIGLVTALTVKDTAGTIVSRSEMAYDESNYAIVTSGSHSRWQNPSNLYRGNPTTSRVWDSSKGSVSNPNSYISTHSQFDNFGNQIMVWDAKGNAFETQFSAYYGYAFPTQLTTSAPDPNGQNGSNTGFTTTSAFDPTTGLPLTTTDANGLETRIEYDPVTLRPLTTKTFYQSAQVGSQAEKVYHDEPNNYWVKSRLQIDTNKWAESITYYDGLGRAYKSEEVNSKGNIFVEKEFDAEGRVKRITNPFRANETKYWTINVYDNSSRMIEVVTTDNAKVKTDYGVVVTGAQIGTSMTVTDQAGRQRRSITNALGQLVRVDEPNDAGQMGTADAPTQPTYYGYDILSNLRTVNQGVQTRSFVYDSLSRLKSANNPESGIIDYNYDNNGNLTSKTDGRNVTVTYNYDALNRVTQRSYIGETGYATPSVFYFYDNLPNAKGKLVKVANSFSTTEYTSFDILGRVSAHKQMTDGQTYTTNYNYDLSGALIEQQYPSGRVVKNTLDENGNLTKIESKKNASDFYRNYATSFVYTAAGAVSSLRLGNGKFENTVYNSRLQPVQIGLGSSATTQDLLKLNFDYGTTDNNGNVKSQTINVPTIGNTQGFTALQNYSYDSLNRIKQAIETINNNQNWKQAFSYDRYGNRRFDEANTTTLLQSCPTAVCNPQVDAATNKLVGYVFDNAGNTKVDPQNRQFIYDGENKQVEVKDADGNSVGRYFYDGDGRRVKKISLTETTVFVYDAKGQLISEHSTQLSNQPQTAYLTADHLGSPRINTNAAGQVISRHDYQPFGEAIVRANYGMDEVRKKFTGYEKDSETDFAYAQARMFGSSLGRFTTVDPGPFDPLNPQVMNRYAYTINNPLKYIDPDGRKIKLTGSAKEIADMKTYLEKTSGFKLEVDKKGNVKIVGTIESASASKDFASELKTILDDKKTATYNVVSEVESVIVDDGEAASDENRNQNVDVNDIKQIDKSAPELAASLTIHALREGLELAKGNKYNAQSQMLPNGNIKEVSPSAHDIALQSENKVMSGISGTTQVRGRAPIVADQKNAAYEFKYTTVTYTVTMVIRGTEKDALSVTKK